MTGRQRLTIALLALALAGCQTGTNTHPVPSVAQIGSDLHCTGGDHGFSDSQVGWGFCYPKFWRYTERAQANTSGTKLDLTLNITVCASSDPLLPCSKPAPGVSPPADVGQFAFMIISTYMRGDSPSLASWIQANLNPPVASPSPTPSSAPSPSTSPSASPTPTATLQPIQWGNATEAALMSDGRRIALTPHLVVILALRSGLDLLDLETPMSARLSTWKFEF